jgi:hypothetical protein
MALIIFGLLMGGFVTGMGVWAVRKARDMQSDALSDQQRARSWSETQARVVRAMVRDRTHGHGKYKAVKAVPDIAYDYDVLGRSYRGNRVRFGMVEFNLPSNAQALVDRYPEGAIIGIRYNPANPGESVIEPVANAQTGMKVALAICWFLVAFGVSFAAFFVYLGLTMR